LAELLFYVPADKKKYHKNKKEKYKQQNTERSYLVVFCNQKL